MNSTAWKFPEIFWPEESECQVEIYRYSYTRIAGRYESSLRSCYTYSHLMHMARHQHVLLPRRWKADPSNLHITQYLSHTEHVQRHLTTATFKLAGTIDPSTSVLLYKPVKQNTIQKSLRCQDYEGITPAMPLSWMDSFCWPPMNRLSSREKYLSKKTRLGLAIWIS
jgi:hypothetical protein